MARLAQLVVDCAHPAGLARFWAEVLDGFSIRAYDDEEIRRLAALGSTPETDPTVVLDGEHLEICFQRTGASPRGGKRSLHLDVVSGDRPADSARFEALGATIVESFERHTWLRDPEGNDFCLVDAAT
jgi:Glyoxalase-like domain